MGEAINYCLSNWKAFCEYVNDGDLAIDNNAAENALRPIVLGRKNVSVRPTPFMFRRPGWRREPSSSGRAGIGRAG